MRAGAAILAAALALPGRGSESLAVVAVADPPGPDAELAEMTHQLRAACRDRAAGVLDVPAMRARLLGQTSSATLAELDRAYGGALATYQNGEYESSIRTLYAIVEDLERIPESAEAYQQRVRALLRLAHAEATLGHQREAREAMEKVLAVEPDYAPDPDQFSPTYRREFEAARQRVAARPRRRLTATALGRPGTVFVNGRALGATPATLVLPAGRYRVGGASGELRVPGFGVDLSEEDRAVVLDFGLAESLRVNAGPGLALAAAARPPALVRAGAWLGADHLLAASIGAEGDVQFLVGTAYDVRRGAILREGKVRMTAGAAPTAHVGALAAFLLTGQPQEAVLPSTPPQQSPPAVAAADPARPVAAALAPAEPPLAAPHAPLGPRGEPPTRGWMRPAAYAAGALALLFASYAGYQGISAANAYGDANSLLLPDGTFKPGADPLRHHSLVAAGDAATRRAYLGAGGTALLAAAAGVLWYLSRESPPLAAGAITLRF